MKLGRVGIVGSGIMATGIAEVAAGAGFEVLLRARSGEAAEAAVAQIASNLDRRVERGRLARQERDALLGRIEASAGGDELSSCGLVIESVVEDLETKLRVFHALDAACSATSVLATNTSTCEVGLLAGATSRPDKVCGLHFFNPAPAMPLVEVVRHAGSSDDTIAGAVSFVEQCGKTPVVVKDEPGFVVNALLFPYLNSAVRLLECDVASRDDIDAAMRGACGYPMGPFALLDLIGLDTAVAILNRLGREDGDASHGPARLLREMVAAGRLGRKSGEGFYRYEPS